MPAPAPSVTRSSSSGIPSQRRDGFALLVTITLLAFLVLLLVSLASLTRVETQVATNTQQITQARQNALMALNLALGQLQRHAGPDQRVTARADLQPLATEATPSTYPTVDPASNVNLSGAAAATLSSIDTFWRASRNRQWTGVWHNNNADPGTYDSNTPASFNAVAALQSWLVSGNENAATFSPSTAITGLSAASTPEDRIADANGQFHRLLVKASAGVTTSADLDRAVTAPEREIRSTSVPGSGAADTIVGHYAWWVGDEGIKARANLADPYAIIPSGETSAERTIRETKRRQSAQRTAIEAMTTGTDGLSPLVPPTNQSALTDYQSKLLNIQSLSQLPYLETSTSLPAALQSRYHDLSVSSRGVLADTKNGGLKGDLSYLFGQSDLSDFRTALRAYYGSPAIAPLNPNPAVHTDLANTFLNPLAATRATFPTITPDGGNYSNESQFKSTSTWEQLWSFANQGSSFNASGQATPRLQKATQHGLYPLVIQTKMFYRLRIVGGSADGDGVNRTGTLSIDSLPLIVLANPYAVPLAPADYQVRISGSSPQLVFGATDSTDKPSDDFLPATGVDKDPANPPSVDPWPNHAFAAPTSYYGNRTFVLRSTTGMAPGEAQIFTIDPDPVANPTIDADDRIAVSSSSDTRIVVMKNEFDPSPSLTYNTSARIPSNAFEPSPAPPPAAQPPATWTTVPTRAALRTGRSGLTTILYMGYTPGDAQGYFKLLQYTAAQTLTADSEFNTGQNHIFIVNPMSDGIRQGGGVNAIINQPPTTDRPAAKPGVGGVFFSHQQAPFLQVNYRTMQVTWAGNDSITNTSHPLEWARRFTKNGSTGLPGNSPNPWFGANLMRPPGSTTTTRWGIINIGEGQEQTVPPNSVGGSNALTAGHVAYNIGFNNYLYDIPRPGRPLSSLGHLQHFNPSGYHPTTNTPSRFTSLSSWQTNYPFSNSYPQPRVPRDKLFNYSNVAPVPMGYHMDGSSIWNDVFWDRFTFSTFPQKATESFDFATDELVNSRYRPFRDLTTAPWDDETKFRGDGNPATAANARAAANNLLVDGAFNINSTSVEAWKAVFSSLKNVQVGTESSPSAPFPRVFAPATGSANAATGISENSWTGFRDLPQADIQSLAEEMVLQVRQRGPFLSLSDFVNRRLISASSDSLKHGLSGALQAALDAAINQPTRLAASFNVQSSVSSNNPVTAARAAAIAEAGYILPAALAGFPGYALQGDVLSALGASLSARSDTFTIRTYGDAVNPATQEVIGRAWCEAVVQRLPDYVDSTPSTDTPAAGSPAATFGRRFHIVSFRWLSPEDI